MSEALVIALIVAGPPLLGAVVGLSLPATALDAQYEVVRMSVTTCSRYGPVGQAHADHPCAARGRAQWDQ